MGPLPHHWEKAVTEKGEVYFIDHNTGSSHWLDPRLSKFQKKSLEECSEDELPFGWECISDPIFGTYYIDHVNRKTQYENPVLQAKRMTERTRMAPKIFSYCFTRNPDELRGERLRVSLRKSTQGLGFTIIGGEDNDEFLQIKSIVPNGPAELDGKLQQGDVLVYVNNICVLGFSHHEMIRLFQSILPSDFVSIDVVRGYPLPFDPDDPNTEIITTVAVDSSKLEQLPMKSYALAIDPIESGRHKETWEIQKADVTFDNMDHEASDLLVLSVQKGPKGFGFTIADSTQGQKVKKIFDSQTCTSIVEGDILVSINNVNVKDMSHSQVVEVLKDCATNETTSIRVLRNNSNKHYSNKYR